MPHDQFIDAVVSSRGVKKQGRFSVEDEKFALCARTIFGMPGVLYKILHSTRLDIVF